jgi:NAD+ kinase
LKAIGIFTNLEKDKGLSVTKKLINELELHRLRVFLTTHIAEILGRRELGAPDDVLFREIDVLMVLGGDGTILNAARKAAPMKIPILGINMGHVGFLSEIEVQDIPKSVQKVLDGLYFIEERMMLSAVVQRENRSGQAMLALNDIGIARGSLSRIIRIEVYVNDHFVDKYPADGFVVSSPTGSTAYSLSAGGPIISPNMRCLLLTPICAHSLHSRPIVIADHEIVRLRVIGQHQDTILTLDGQQDFTICKDDWIIIQKASANARFIRLKEENFYSLLRHKLSEWSGYSNDDD